LILFLLLLLQKPFRKYDIIWFWHARVIFLRRVIIMFLLNTLTLRSFRAVKYIQITLDNLILEILYLLKVYLPRVISSSYLFLHLSFFSFLNNLSHVIIKIRIATSLFLRTLHIFKSVISIILSLNIIEDFIS